MILFIFISTLTHFHFLMQINMFDNTFFTSVDEKEYISCSPHLSVKIVRSFWNRIKQLAR